jgi:hypothetical protein
MSFYSENFTEFCINGINEVINLRICYSADIKLIYMLFYIRLKYKIMIDNIVIFCMYYV